MKINVMTYEAFNKLPDEQMKQVLTDYRVNFTNDEIRKAWGLSNKAYYDLVKDLGVPKAPRTNRKGTAKDKNPKMVKTPVEAYLVEEQATQVPAISSPEADGFGFSIIGKHSAETLIKRLEKLSLVLSDEESDFEVNIKINEIV